MPAVTLFPKDGLKLPFEELASIVEVFFGVGFGDADGRERFIENANDPPLLGRRRNRNWITLNEFLGNALVSYSTGHSSCTFITERLTGKVVVKPFTADFAVRAENEVFAGTKPDAICRTLYNP